MGIADLGGMYLRDEGSGAKVEGGGAGVEGSGAAVKGRSARDEGRGVKDSTVSVSYVLELRVSILSAVLTTRRPKAKISEFQPYRNPPPTSLVTLCACGYSVYLTGLSWSDFPCEGSILALCLAQRCSRWSALGF